MAVIGFAAGASPARTTSWSPRLRRTTSACSRSPATPLHSCPAGSERAAPELTCRTAVRLPGTEVPHHLTVSGRAIQEIVGAMGGVQVDVAETTGRASVEGTKITLCPGPQTLDDEALVYYLCKDVWDGADETPAPSPLSGAPSDVFSREPYLRVRHARRRVRAYRDEHESYRDRSRSSAASGREEPPACPYKRAWSPAGRSPRRSGDQVLGAGRPEAGEMLDEIVC